MDHRVHLQGSLRKPCDDQKLSHHRRPPGFLHTRFEFTEARERPTTLPVSFKDHLTIPA